MEPQVTQLDDVSDLRNKAPPRRGGYTNLNFGARWADLVRLFTLILCSLQVGAIADEQIGNRLDRARGGGVCRRGATFGTCVAVCILYPELETAIVKWWAGQSVLVAYGGGSVYGSGRGFT